jgi:radical SAM superfamily enzyme YgiQ (UPF0313 family)
MPNITLATLNARYIHASLGLRYLKANMGELAPQTTIKEFIITHRPIDMAERLLADRPAIIGLGVYIWNVRETTQLVQLIKTVSPETVVVLGGPEVSYETEEQVICQAADYVITGMADLAFAQLCRDILAGTRPIQKIIPAQQPTLASLRLPYDQFSEEDIRNRIIYVEASRGCPFKCEFCLSALDKTAWPFDIDAFLQAMQHLYDQGVRHFKFVDRTFNLKVESSIRILEFFLAKEDEDLFLHFELIPDHLPERLKAAIQRFPSGSLQFEIGIQTFNPEVQARISRKQDNAKARANIHWLTEETSAHLHTDLIVGLPGEDMASFAGGFDQLMALKPHEIQVGILKRLRGTPIIRHTQHYGMRYNPAPPYNILATDHIDFEQMQRLSRFARYWDLVANSGRFKHTLPLLLGEQPFDGFMRFSDWLFHTTQQTHQIALKRLFRFIHQYLITELGITTINAESALITDYTQTGQKGTPEFFQSSGTQPKIEPQKAHTREKTTSGTKRQARHVL